VLSRRAFLGAGLGAVVLAAGCDTSRARPSPRLILPTDPAVARREAERRVRGAATVHRKLRSVVGDVDLGGRVVRTWSYDGTIPAPVLRARIGDVLDVDLGNDLPESTTIHWHGIELRNDMDGVHHLTQAGVDPGRHFRYRFVVDAPGTYWYHSHVGTQADRGLYAPIVVEDPAAAPVDVEHVLVLDDWIDGLGATPDRIAELLECRTDCPPSPFIGDFRSDALGGAVGRIAYPGYLVNGKLPSDPPTFTAAPGARVRLRIVNAGAETPFRFAIGGHRLLVTHSDGYAVRPVEVDALILGMGERYDVELTAASGVFPIAVVPEGKPGFAAARLRTTDVAPTATAPPADARPAELDGRLLTYRDLEADPAVALDFVRPDRRYDVSLTGRDANYHWGIDGEPYGHNGSIDVRPGERARVRVTNTTNHVHPMHLHGHTFRLGGARLGPRKDTVLVQPGETFDFDVLCDNPGQWMLHCHNGYHLDVGMAIPFRYVR